MFTGFGILYFVLCLLLAGQGTSVAISLEPTLSHKIEQYNHANPTGKDGPFVAVLATDISSPVLDIVKQ